MEPDLLDDDENRAYYDERFAAGYMDAWNAETRARVEEFARHCDLGSATAILDFGCGEGEFTTLLHDVVPGARCVGTDVSTVALAAARSKYPELDFFDLDERPRGRFDVVFTHHVLEHVADLDATLRVMNELTSHDATVVHILPCGNPGSLEERLCARVRDGISPSGRFVFEDEGHVRRLTSEDLVARMHADGFELESAWFGGHRWGAVDWITASPVFVRFPRLRDARSFTDLLRLAPFRLGFLALGLLRAPVAIRSTYGIGDRSRWSTTRRLLVAIAWVLAPISRPISRVVERRSDEEWRAARHDPAGSSMYLSFRRGEAGR